MPAPSSDPDNGHLTGYGSPSYRHYVLVLLMLVYTLNFVDRTLIAVVAQPIIESFQLTDAQWGLLYGPPFAIFYAVMGLPDRPVGRPGQSRQCHRHLHRAVVDHDRAVRDRRRLRHAAAYSGLEWRLEKPAAPRLPIR